MSEDRGAASAFGSSIGVYDLLADRYDALFEVEGHRNIYDTLAWEHVARFTPAGAGTIIDAGCGTGRWAANWLAAGHRVIGIEQSPRMVEVLTGKNLGPRFELIQASMESAVIAPACADLVVAMGSVHYTEDPGTMLRSFARWVKPGGAVCVYVDSLVALTLEFLRLHQASQAFESLESRRGVWQQGDARAHVHLFDRRALEALFTAAGLTDLQSHGLLVTASAWGRERYTQEIRTDPQKFLELERQLSQFPLLADVGKHLLVTGRRAAG